MTTPQLPLTLAQWKVAALTILEQLGTPVVEATHAQNQLGARQISFLPGHSPQDGFKRLVELTRPDLVVIWFDETKSGHVRDWNFHLYGESDMTITCFDPEVLEAGDTSTGQNEEASSLATSPDHPEDKSEFDFDAFEDNEEALQPHLDPSARLVLTKSLAQALAPGDVRIASMFEAYADQAEVAEPLRPLLRAYLPLHGRDLVDNGIIEAHRADFRDRSTEHAKEVFANVPGLEKLKKPVLMGIVWDYMKKTHGARCAAKYSVEPIVDELRQIIRG